jgi:hypothetical protein
MVRAVEITRKLDDDYYEICGPFGRFRKELEFVHRPV